MVARRDPISVRVPTGIDEKVLPQSTSINRRLPTEPYWCYCCLWCVTDAIVSLMNVLCQPNNKVLPPWRLQIGYFSLYGFTEWLEQFYRPHLKISSLSLVKIWTWITSITLLLIYCLFRWIHGSGTWSNKCTCAYRHWRESLAAVHILQQEAANWAILMLLLSLV